MRLILCHDELLSAIDRGPKPRNDERTTTVAAIAAFTYCCNSAGSLRWVAPNMSDLPQRPDAVTRMIDALSEVTIRAQGQTFSMLVRSIQTRIRFRECPKEIDFPEHREELIKRLQQECETFQREAPKLLNAEGGRELSDAEIKQLAETYIEDHIVGEWPGLIDQALQILTDWRAVRHETERALLEVAPFVNDQRQPAIDRWTTRARRTLERLYFGRIKLVYAPEFSDRNMVEGFISNVGHTSEPPDWTDVLCELARMREELLAIREQSEDPGGADDHTSSTLPGPDETTHRGGADRASAPLNEEGVPSNQVPLTWHSDDFHSVRWYGTLYTFTSNQARCVQELWRAWETGVPELTDGRLLEKARAGDARRLRDVFKVAGNKMHEAWGKMIQPGERRGTRRLAPAKENEIPT